MIDLTPLDVRRKKGDFRRALRGYDADLVDDFLDAAADRLEEMVRENSSLAERVRQLEERVADYTEREKALTEALVSAQEFRQERISQAAREAELQIREARAEADKIRREALRDREREDEALRRARARRAQLVEGFRAFLERELRQLAVEAAALVPHEPEGGTGRGWEPGEEPAAERSSGPDTWPHDAPVSAAQHTFLHEPASHSAPPPPAQPVQPAEPPPPPLPRSRWEPPEPVAEPPREEPPGPVESAGAAAPASAEEPAPPESARPSAWERYAPAPAVVVAAAREADDHVESAGLPEIAAAELAADAAPNEPEAAPLFAGDGAPEAEAEPSPEPDASTPGEPADGLTREDGELPPITGNEPWLPLLEDER